MTEKSLSEREYDKLKSARTNPSLVNHEQFRRNFILRCNELSGDGTQPVNISVNEGAIELSVYGDFPEETNGYYTGVRYKRKYSFSLEPYFGASLFCERMHAHQISKYPQEKKDCHQYSKKLRVFLEGEQIGDAFYTQYDYSPADLVKEPSLEFGNLPELTIGGTISGDLLHSVPSNNYGYEIKGRPAEAILLK